jgi:hypothetical protein
MFEIISDYVFVGRFFAITIKFRPPRSLATLPPRRRLYQSLSQTQHPRRRRRRRRADQR